jgi:hypothetical protein
MFHRWARLQPLLLAYNTILPISKVISAWFVVCGYDITLSVQDMYFIHLHPSFAFNAAALRDKTSGFPFSYTQLNASLN